MKRLLLLVFLSLAAATAIAQEIPVNDSLVKNTLTVATSQGEIPFIVELAMTRQEQETGLMNRKHLPENEGMLFLLNHDRQVDMWMKDTYIPLDILFIDAQGKITDIAENTPPLTLETVSSTGPVHAVLELPAGTAGKHGIEPGDTVNHHYFKP